MHVHVVIVGLGAFETAPQHLIDHENGWGTTINTRGAGRVARKIEGLRTSSPATRG